MTSDPIDFWGGAATCAAVILVLGAVFFGGTYGLSWAYRQTSSYAHRQEVRAEKRAWCEANGGFYDGRSCQFPPCQMKGAP